MSVNYPIREVTSDSEAFLAVLDHLFTQGKRSMQYEIGDCVYRGSNTPNEESLDGVYGPLDLDLEFWHPENEPLACAVGCLISDKYYTSDIEGEIVDSVKIQNIIRLSHPNWPIDEQSFTILRNLQVLHDRVEPNYWAFVLTCFGLEGFKEIAMSYYLKKSASMILKAMKALNPELLMEDYKEFKLHGNFE